MVPSAEEKENVRTAMILALSDAVRHAFLTLAGMTAEVGPVEIDEPPQVAEKAVAAVIGWVGEWQGTGILECTPDFACELTGMLLGEEISEVNADVMDCVAEVSNIVFGTMKSGMETQVGPLGLSTPTVVFGEHVGMRNRGETFQLIPIRIGKHALRVKVSMHVAITSRFEKNWRAAAAQN